MGQGCFPRRVALLFFLAIRATAHAEALIALQPIKADGAFTVINNEIFIPGGGTKVVLEIRVGGWSPLFLKTYQVRINGQGYQNGLSTIGPISVPCSGTNAAGHAQCAAAVDPGSRCINTPADGLRCEAGFQNTSRSDWIGFSVGYIAAVDVSTPDFRYGMTAIPPDSVEDTGGTRYAGTLVLSIPPGASGTFVIGFKPNECFLQDDSVPIPVNIPIGMFIPGIITIGEPKLPRNRYLMFTPTAAGEVTAVRVALTSLYRPWFPIGRPPGSGFPTFENQIRWLGPPADFPERGSFGTTFKGAMLQCDPYFMDWGSLGTVEVFGDAVIPSSVYTFRQLSVECKDTPNDPQCLTAPVRLRTGDWGDVAAPFARVDQAAQPDMIDLAQIADSYRGLPDSLTKTHAQLRGNVVAIQHDVNFVDVAHAADAAKGLAYPYPGPATCP